MRTWIPRSRFQWASLVLALSGLFVATGGFTATFFVEMSHVRQLVRQFQFMFLLMLVICPMAYRFLQRLDDEDRAGSNS